MFFMHCETGLQVLRRRRLPALVACGCASGWMAGGRSRDHRRVPAFLRFTRAGAGTDRVDAGILSEVRWVRSHQRRRRGAGWSVSPGVQAQGVGLPDGLGVCFQARRAIQDVSDSDHHVRQVEQVHGARPNCSGSRRGDVSPVEPVHSHEACLQGTDAALPIGEVPNHREADEAQRCGCQTLNEPVPVSQNQASAEADQQPEAGIRQDVEQEQRDVALLPEQQDQPKR